MRVLRSISVLLLLVCTANAWGEFFTMQDFGNSGCQNGRCNRQGFESNGSRTFSTNGFRPPRVINQNISSSSSSSSSTQTSQSTIPPNIQQLAREGYFRHPVFDKIFYRSVGGKNYMYYLGTNGRPYPVIIKADGRAYFNGTNDSINDYVKSYYRYLRKERPEQFEELGPRFAALSGGKDFLGKLDSNASGDSPSSGSSSNSPPSNGSSSDSVDNDIAPPPKPDDEGEKREEPSSGHENESPLGGVLKGRAQNGPPANEKFAAAKARFDALEGKQAQENPPEGYDKYFPPHAMSCTSRSGHSDYKLKLSVTDAARDPRLAVGGPVRTFFSVLEENDPRDEGKDVNPREIWNHQEEFENKNGTLTFKDDREFQLRYLDKEARTRPVLFISGNLLGKDHIPEPEQWICEAETPVKKTEEKGLELPRLANLDENGMSPTLEEWRNAVKTFPKTNEGHVLRMQCPGEPYHDIYRFGLSSSGDLILRTKNRREICHPELSSLSNGIKFYDNEEKLCSNFVIKKIPTGDGRAKLAISKFQQDCNVLDSPDLAYDDKAPKGRISSDGEPLHKELRRAIAKGAPVKDLLGHLPIMRKIGAPDDMEKVKDEAGSEARRVFIDQLNYQIVKDYLAGKGTIDDLKTAHFGKTQEKFKAMGYDVNAYNLLRLREVIHVLDNTTRLAAQLRTEDQVGFSKAKDLFIRNITDKTASNDDEILAAKQALPQRNEANKDLYDSMETLLNALSVKP